MAKNKWIQEMHMKKGALHRQLHVPEGQKIPREKLEKAAHAGGKLGQRARLALTLGKMHHSPSHNSTTDHKQSFYSPKVAFSDHCPRKMDKK